MSGASPSEFFACTLGQQWREGTVSVFFVYLFKSRAATEPARHSTDTQSSTQKLKPNKETITTVFKF